jgi:4-hydroxythreonine-4-phosphate dehydrogenase
MKTKPMLIFAGDPNSIFFEIFFKALRYKKFQSPIILISSIQILKSQIKKYKFKKDIKILSLHDLKRVSLNNKSVNLININYDKKKPKNYIKDCFNTAFQILKSKYSYKFINGPINKSKFLDKKFPGITEYISENFKIKSNAMLIFNKELSVCPITTHLPLKLVTKTINQRLIKEKAFLINKFFIKNIGMKPKIGVAGLNPHCESIHKFNEDKKIVLPAIKKLKKKGLKIFGPLSADTIFLKQNRAKYDVIIGMYHDQVLSPLKTLKEYDAINITLGLPFFRISPDHGPNENMINKNLSNPLSLIRALEFLDKR